MHRIPSVAGERSAVKVSTGFDLVFILEQIGSTVIDKKKKSGQPQIVYFFYNQVYIDVLSMKKKT